MAQINIRINDELKKAAEEVCREIGIPLSTAIAIYLRRIAGEGRIPFELKAISFRNAEGNLHETEELHYEQ